jgi:predicted neutral ceramidase superfamily lipid hydrolase
MKSRKEKALLVLFDILQHIILNKKTFSEDDQPLHDSMLMLRRTANGFVVDCGNLVEKSQISTLKSFYDNLTQNAKEDFKNFNAQNNPNRASKDKSAHSGAPKPADIQYQIHTLGTSAFVEISFNIAALS